MSRHRFAFVMWSLGIAAVGACSAGNFVWDESVPPWIGIVAGVLMGGAGVLWQDPTDGPS